MQDSAIDGRALAVHHRDGHATDDGIRLVAYAESPRADDWSLRSALVRYAQPEPARASAVLELVRRTDGALKPFHRLLESTEVATDPSLATARVDARTTDLARVAVCAPDDLDRVLSEYESVQQLDSEERTVVLLLAVAVELDALGDILAAWALDRSRRRPDAEVDAISRRAFTMLGALGVDRERRPPRRGEGAAGVRASRARG